MSRQNDRFDILRTLAVAGSSGEDLTLLTRNALSQAVELVGLAAAALYLWDDDLRTTVTVVHATSEADRKRLQSLEDELFSGLRRNKELVSAYMSFGGDAPYNSFTLPLRHGARIFGAVIGLQEGERTIVSENLFLEAISALLALNYAASQVTVSAQPTQEALQKEKLSGIVETAVTVNHEVNSPLTAILGNIQLLLRDRDDLDEDLLAKLKTIELSAEKIQDVTRRLLKVTTPRSIDYAEGIKMLDISDEEKS